MESKRVFRAYYGKNPIRLLCRKFFNQDLGLQLIGIICIHETRAKCDFFKMFCYLTLITLEVSYPLFLAMSSRRL